MPFTRVCWGCWTCWDPRDKVFRSVNLPGPLWQTFKNFEKHSKLLLEALSVNKITTLDDPIKATFNGPLTPFFVRRNEVMVRLK